MYTERYKFKTFVNYMKKVGRARPLSIENLRILWKIWSDSMDSGKNSVMVEGKRVIQREYSRMMHRASWNRIMSENFNAFLTHENEFFEALTYTEPVRALDNLIPSIKIDVSPLCEAGKVSDTFTDSHTIQKKERNNGKLCWKDQDLFASS